MAATTHSSSPHSSSSSLPVAPPPVITGRSDRLVRLLFTDLSGQRRVRVVPWDRFRALTVAQGVGLARCIYAFASFADGPAPGCGLSCAGEVRLMPDVSTLRTLPWCPSQMVALGDAHVAPNEPFAVCPRSTLKRVAGQLKEKYGLVLRAGFESEFTLLSSTTPSLLPTDHTLYCSAAAFDDQAELMNDVVTALHGMGIGVEQLHPESGSGQFEVAVEHAADVAAADRVLLVREAISGVVKRHASCRQEEGRQPMHVTFLPQVFRNEAANGSHVHLSIWRQVSNSSAASPSASGVGLPTIVDEQGRTYENAFTAEGSRQQQQKQQGDQSDRFGLSVSGACFMAGVMAHLPAIMAISCPLPNSYERLGPNKWSGGFQCWGRENREAAIRLASPPDPAAAAAAADAGDDAAAVSASAAAASSLSPLRPTNFELKSCDACAQPHLVLAAVIAVGMDGMERRMRLPDPIDINPADIPRDSALAPPRLPVTLLESVAALEADAAIAAALGAPMMEAILAVRKAEIDHYTGRAPAVNQLVHKY